MICQEKNEKNIKKCKKRRKNEKKRKIILQKESPERRKNGERRMKIKEFEFQNTEMYHQMMDYVSNVYKITKKFPQSEIYGLTNQIRRASVSVALNFAEGWGRYNKKEKAQFYKISRASILECVAAIDIALRQNYIEKTNYQKMLDESNEISKKLNALIKRMGDKE